MREATYPVGDEKRYTVELTDKALGEIHEAIEARLHSVVDALRFSAEYPGSTTKWLWKQADDLQLAYDEFWEQWSAAIDGSETHPR